jgi:hypothetical protein
MMQDEDINQADIDKLLRDNPLAWLTGNRLQT